MLWAIDVGNTQTVVGVRRDGAWVAVWRFETHWLETEDELAVKLSGLAKLAGLPFEAAGIVVGSVVPAVNVTWSRLGEKWLGRRPKFLTGGDQVGLKVSYDPPHAVGADRIANALAALDRWKPPIIVVDFGTATTFDAIDGEGTYVGGAILPGILVSMEALVGKTAKLPQIEIAAPETAIGRTTVGALQSGIVLGYAGAIDALARKIAGELAEPVRVVATGGLGGLFVDLCEMIECYEPHLTLDGLALAWTR